MRTLTTTDFPSLTLARRGKVRDVYDIGQHLLIVATDRISAFDVVLPTPIPDKGRVLTQLSCFWFAETSHLVPNHLVTADVTRYPAPVRDFAEDLEGRSMLVRRARPLPVECIVRGYLVGSGWNEYRRSGTVCGIELPGGLVEAGQLPEPLFTPSTKAEGGAHDENIPFTEMVRLVGEPLASRVRDASIAIYRHAAAFAEARGIIIADTKFEFGLAEPGGELLLIDEALTSDSSRFWPRREYRPGASPPSFDKQYVRDYLDSIRWDRRPPAPELPAEVVENTRARYMEALERLTGPATDERRA